MVKEKESQPPEWVRNLRRLMDDRGMNPRSLSLKAGLNATAVRDMIEGRSRFPRYDTVEALSEALETTPAMLMASGKSRDSIRARGEGFSRDIEFLTEIIARLQETAEELGRSLTPREFAAMAAAIYRKLMEDGALNAKNRNAAIKPQIHDLLEYEMLRARRAK